MCVCVCVCHVDTLVDTLQDDVLEDDDEEIVIDDAMLDGELAAMDEESEQVSCEISGS